jgi:hypothetical protein
MIFLRHILTGADNATWHLGKVAGFIAFLVGLALEVYCVLAGKAFDFIGYGAGVAAMAAGIGALIKLQETSEPGARV